MTDETQCPQCKGNRTVSGNYLGQTDQIGIGQVFRPDGLKFSAMFGTDLPISKRFRACADCGLLWQIIDPSKLTRIMEKKGTVKTKQAMGLK
jgi:hypothetical protein